MIEMKKRNKNEEKRKRKERKRYYVLNGVNEIIFNLDLI